MVDEVNQGSKGAMAKASHEDEGLLVSLLLQEVLEEQAGGGEDQPVSLNPLAILAH